MIVINERIVQNYFLAKKKKSNSNHIKNKSYRNENAMKYLIILTFDIYLKKKENREKNDLKH